VPRAKLCAVTSEQHLATIRRGIDAFNAGDAAVFSEFATDDFVWIPALPGTVGGAQYVGRSGIDRYFSEVGETWQRLRVECDELRADGEIVVMLGRAVGRGGGSGAGVEMPLAFVAEFSGGRIAKVTAFLSHAEALACAGLA
jgi:ketosteroid isomerase-like protein